MEGEQQVYMHQPPRYMLAGHADLVCKHKKSIYGLKQAPKYWYKVLHKFFTNLGFVRCSKEYCIYVQKVGESWIIVVVYVDDLTIMSKDIELISKLKQDLSGRFKMKDLEDIHYILKMEVRRNRKNRTMTISQHKYIDELLDKFNMGHCTAVTTPQLKEVELVAETKMSPQEIAAQKFDFRGLVGSLQYLVRGTRPDIANAVRELSKFLSSYNKTHWEAARRVLKYLKGTSTYGLLLHGNSRMVTYEVYTDASFACQPKQRKSVVYGTTLMAGMEPLGLGKLPPLF
ncbi:hypothetical protein ON010_g18802 [Phytophthora cinnamomi]|nr:hypothetical protein ON010_g18802 [Phytophthora cinnamomi]